MANKFYGKYKNVRNAVWKIMIDFRISTLPVSVTALAKKLDIIPVSYVQGIELIKLAGLENRLEKEKAFLAHIKNAWYIFFDDTQPRTKIRFYLAHELGHFLLGHEVKINNLNKDISVEVIDEKKRKSTYETEADMFAMRLLAPACVLWGLNIVDEADIILLCGICTKEAKQRAKRMAELYERNKFLTSPLERKVFAQFEDFIESMKSNY